MKPLIPISLLTISVCVVASTIAMLSTEPDPSVSIASKPQSPTAEHSYPWLAKSLFPSHTKRGYLEVFPSHAMNTPIGELSLYGKQILGIPVEEITYCMVSAKKDALIYDLTNRNSGKLEGAVIVLNAESEYASIHTLARRLSAALSSASTQPDAAASATHSNSGNKHVLPIPGTPMALFSLPEGDGSKGERAFIICQQSEASRLQNRWQNTFSQKNFHPEALQASSPVFRAVFTPTQADGSLLRMIFLPKLPQKLDHVERIECTATLDPKCSVTWRLSLPENIAAQELVSAISTYKSTLAGKLKEAFAIGEKKLTTLRANARTDAEIRSSNGFATFIRNGKPIVADLMDFRVKALDDSTLLVANDLEMRTLAYMPRLKELLMDQVSGHFLNRSKENSPSGQADSLSE